MKLTPASRAARQSWLAVASSASPPNDIVPSAMRDTLTPVLPRKRSISDRPVSSARERRIDAREHLLLRRRHLADAEEAARSSGDHLREPDDLVLEQLVLLVVELT